MEWPEELQAKLMQGIEVIPAIGHTQASIARFILDEFAAGIVFRGNGDPDTVRDLVASIPTVLGAIVPYVILSADITYGVGLNEHWSAAVDAIHEFARQNARQICEEYTGYPTEWGEMIHQDALDFWNGDPNAPDEPGGSMDWESDDGPPEDPLG